jgi:hypothetical protein
MMRRIGNLATLACLGVALLAGGIWIRSYWRFDFLMIVRNQLDPNSSAIGVWTNDGSLGIGRWLTFPNSDFNSGWNFGSRPTIRFPHSLIEFHAWRIPDMNGVREEIVFPLWVVILATIPWLILRLRTIMRHRRRVAANACKTCGYDLRATPDRCPECGTANVAQPTR